MVRSAGAITFEMAEPMALIADTITVRSIPKICAGAGGGATKAMTNKRAISALLWLPIISKTCAISRSLLLQRQSRLLPEFVSHVRVAFANCVCVCDDGGLFAHCRRQHPLRHRLVFDGSNQARGAQPGSGTRRRLPCLVLDDPGRLERLFD